MIIPVTFKTPDEVADVVKNLTQKQMYEDDVSNEEWTNGYKLVDIVYKKL